VFGATNHKKYPKIAAFMAFFSLQAVPDSRMIGLTKKRLKHFRIVLFFANFPDWASE
jgi:hypothetical protein